jgi:hypothetical protein
MKQLIFLNMQKSIPLTISVLLHPLIIPSIGLLMLMNSGTHLDFLSFQHKRAIFLILLTGTSLLPLTIIPLMFLRKNVSGITMENHRERLLPLMATSLFYIFTCFILNRIKVPGLIMVYSLTASQMVLLCTIISLKWKISLHMTALGALAGVLLAIAFRFNINLLFHLTLVFIAGGLAGWARLSLKAHTPAQVYTGYTAGLLLAYFMLSTF